MAKKASGTDTMIPGLLPDPKDGPSDKLERAWRLSGAPMVAGVDEAGRGPLAGPVVAAAVILPAELSASATDALAQLNDSKKLTARRRLVLHGAIMQHALAVTIASVSATSIDESDIRKASLEAMRRCIAGLSIKPDAALFDGRDVPPGLPVALKRQAVIKGDAISVSIAAASIIAKVTRDQMMVALGKDHPAYGLEGHMGYGSAKHCDAISEIGGVQRVHRFSFRPLKA